MSQVMESTRESGRLIFWRLLSWVLLCCLALTVMMVAAAQLPGRLKLIGLFGLGLGLASGWVVGKVAQLRCVHYRRIMFLLATLLITIALAGMVAESYRRWHKDRLEQFNAEINESPTARLLGLETFKEMTDSVGGIDVFLDYRYSALSQSTLTIFQTAARWPRLLLGLELILGGLAGGAIATRMVRKPFCVTCGSWHERQRSLSLEPLRGNRCLKLLVQEESEPLPKDAILNVEYSGCRCGGAIPTIRCSIERPGQAPRTVVTLQPDRETFSQLSDILDGDGAVE